VTITARPSSVVNLVLILVTISDSPQSYLLIDTSVHRRRPGRRRPRWKVGSCGKRAVESSARRTARPNDERRNVGWVTSAMLLVDGFGRIREVVHHSVDGLDEDQLTYRLQNEANSIAWLVWHLTRIQDDHVAGVAGTEQVWPKWADRFGLPFDLHDTGYGHGPAQVAAVRVPAELLTGYHDETYERTIEYVSGITDPDLGRVVDAHWDPPVTLGVRLVSVVSDDLQHAGQAAFVRGLLPR
jgi:uncharacterized damage-inducible protein DinB